MKNSFSEKTLFAAMAGVPNVGKSTLMDKLVGARIAIISPKPQTTRNRITGIITRGATQFVFVDTPGFHTPKTKLGERMVKTVRDSVADVDCALLVTWAKEEFNELETKLLDELSAAKTPVALIINKSDTVEKEKIDRAFDALTKDRKFVFTAAVSALNGDGIEELFDKLDGIAKEGPHLFDEDSLTDIPEKVIAAELIREQLLLNLRDELPHGCAVSVERFKERENADILDIDAEIICEKESHKGMIIGKGGSMLKTIGSAARIEIEEFLDCRVNLKLWVKVREDWRNKQYYFKDLGY